MSQAKADAFVCPGCGEQLEVSAEVRTAVLENACPLCGTTVETADFDGSA